MTSHTPNRALHTDEIGMALAKFTLLNANVGVNFRKGQEHMENHMYQISPEYFAQFQTTAR